ncbi:hypothetical protein QTO34_008682 [Cnephaeus nilssonii]|uniref:Charged multivesicular body protein 6 n=1 Tax=Cnephaeus nilssonii TaxID=3371016 RepID=A0AA40HGE2_CNENI|nr:hypothetical protein QTO34_008682 [Eptesicus nilssonii]
MPRRAGCRCDAGDGDGLGRNGKAGRGRAGPGAPVTEPPSGLRRGPRSARSRVVHSDASVTGAGNLSPRGGGGTISPRGPAAPDPTQSSTWARPAGSGATRPDGQECRRTLPWAPWEAEGAPWGPRAGSLARAGAAGPAFTQTRPRQQLKQQRDKLRQYQRRVTQQLEREREVARQLLREGRKERAKLLLRKKRYREQLLDKTENQIASLETMVQSIEFTQIEMKVIEGLKFGNECLNKMHQVMSIEEVERVLDETQEAVEYQRQIDELLAGSFTQEDEAAILEELDAITQEQIELPEVPSEPLPEKPGTCSLFGPRGTALSRAGALAMGAAPRLPGRGFTLALAGDRES